MSDFDTGFEGTGSFFSFVATVVELLEAMNNINVIMPKYYSGNEPSLEFQESKLIFDMADALIFSLRNVEWDFTGIAQIDSSIVSVDNGKLVIEVESNPDLNNIDWDFSGSADIDDYSADIYNGALRISVEANDS